MNVTEYIIKFGGTKMNLSNIRESDFIALAALSYLHFPSGLESFTNKVRLKDVIEYILSDPIHYSIMGTKNRKLAEAALNSKRFADVYVCGCKDVLDDIDAVQFFALTFEIDKDVYALVYRGTDGTVAGWKEDFRFSFSKRTHSQKIALDYIETASSKLNGKFFLCGHSKGGNHASYAAIYAPKKIRDRIEAVYCFDSPGFNQKHQIKREKGYIEIADRIITIVPQNSFIGLLLETFPNKRVIHSDSDNVLWQHDINTWQINRFGSPDYDRSGKVNSETYDLLNVINFIISSVPDDLLEFAVDVIFGFLEENDIRYVDSKKLMLSMIGVIN